MILARRARGPTEQEVAVVAAILDGSGDPRAASLLDQLTQARRVERRIDGAHLHVAVPWTTDDLLVDLDEDVVSDPVRVHDHRSGTVLSFRLHLARGGFLKSLHGEAEGPWPRRWVVDAAELAAAAAGALHLPGGEGLLPQAFAEWVGVPVPGSADVRLRRPATAHGVTELEQREGAPLPADVKELLLMTDGAVLEGWALLGVRDLHLVEIAGSSYWQIAVGAGAADERRCLHSGDQLAVVSAHDASRFQVVAVTLRGWLAHLLGEPSGHATTE